MTLLKQIKHVGVPGEMLGSEEAAVAMMHGVRHL